MKVHFYCKKISKDHEAHEKNGFKLREKAIISPLCDTKTFGKDFEKLLNGILKYIEIYIDGFNDLIKYENSTRTNNIWSNYIKSKNS